MNEPWYQNPLTLVTFAYTVLTGFLVIFMAVQTFLQRRLFRLQMFLMVMERLEKTRDDRRVLRTWIKNQSKTGAGAQSTIQVTTNPAGIPVPPNDTAVAEAADRVCREYDIVGLLERTGFLDSGLLDQFYSPPFAILYRDYLSDYIQHQRTDRGDTHFWELDQFAKRVQWVDKNHPALHKKNRWSWFRWARRRER